MTRAVRPVRAWIVRQERAAENVSQMLDARPAAERHVDSPPPVQPQRVVDSEAYDGPASAMFVYRLRRGDAEHVGVVGDVSAEAFVDGRVRGHEAVQPDRVEGLVQHFASAVVRSELVALLHHTGPAVEAAIAEIVGGRPEIQFTGPDDWEQTVWRVPDSAIEVLSGELSDGVHYIADGHHRVAASLDVWRDDGEPSEAALMCVIYPLDGLRLLSFHRRVTGPVDLDELRGLVAGSFDVSEVADPDEATGCFHFYADGCWWDAAYPGSRPPGAAGLDIAILNDRVIDPLLTLEPATSRLEFASSLSPLEELTKACDEDGGVLFALRPASLEQLFEVADRGEVMPPKSTYFDPKPYAGIFLR